MTEKELLAKAELGTYFEGLCDAYKMTKSQIRKAIEIISNSEEY